MEEQYEVEFSGRMAGKVQLLRQGLYVRIICRCMVPGDQVLRLYAVLDERKENLGVVVPDGDGFLLDKKIPAKRLGEGRLKFVLSSGCGPRPGKFVPICPEEPFLYIDRLKDAFLQSEHDKIGIRLSKHPEAV